MAGMLLIAACSSVPTEEDAALAAFDRIAFLFREYDTAQSRQDLRILGVLSADLNRVSKANFERLVAALSSNDQERQGYAAFALGFSKDRAAVGPLAQATAHPHETVRSSAIFALGLLAFDDIPLAPFRNLMEDKVPEVRQAALFGLRPLVGGGNDRGMIDAIHRKLADPEPNVRNEALILLRKIRSKESIEKLLGAPIKDADPLLRSNAVLALGAMGKEGVSANPYLIEMLKDDMSKVVESAWVALNKINQKDFDRSYATWRDWYEDEQGHYYGCFDHKEVSRSTPGECPTCAKNLDRIPKEEVKRGEAQVGRYACPDHAEVLTTSPSKCGKPGCGKALLPAKQ
jgi:hypothetical protein